MKRALGQIGILVLMIVAVGGVYGSFFAMAVTMGWGWTFLPHLMASVGLVGIAAFLSWRFSANRGWAAAVGVVRWLAVLPVASGLYYASVTFFSFMIGVAKKYKASTSRLRFYCSA